MQLFNSWICRTTINQNSHLQLKLMHTIKTKKQVPGSENCSWTSRTACNPTTFRCGHKRWHTSLLMPKTSWPSNSNSYSFRWYTLCPVRRRSDKMLMNQKHLGGKDDSTHLHTHLQLSDEDDDRSPVLPAPVTREHTGVGTSASAQHQSELTLV